MLLKKQQPTQIKLLHKKFHFLNRADIKIIYDFCEQDFTKTQKILTIIKDIRNPQSIVKTLLEKPQKGNVLLASFQRRYDQKYASIVAEGENIGKDSPRSRKFNFFKYIPYDVLLSISVYLDPYSMANFSMTYSKISKLYLSQNFNEYFKLLCINLFEKQQAKLPTISRFVDVRNYVFKQGNQFGPNTRNAVTNNLRYYIWGKNVELQKKSVVYFQSFGSYRNLFFKRPRVHYNGLYVCKHQYRKEEQKNLLTNTGQVHLVSYYRYFRFFEDGSIMSAVFPNKQKSSSVAQLLTSDLLGADPETLSKNIMIGQYFQSQNNIEAKLFKQGTLFTYQLQLKSSQSANKNEITNHLIVNLYYLKVVDEKQIVQVLQKYDEKCPMIFKYCFMPSIRKQNSNLVRSSGL